MNRDCYSPTNPQDAQEFARQAAADEKSILAIGNDSRRARLQPGLGGDLVLSTSQMTQIHWLDAEDRTCEVDAGICPAELDSVLAQHGLMVGALGGGWQTGTLGGYFNSGEPSLLAGSCGLPRDQILGATWLLPNGKIIRSGARVVKSVAGYDVTRLFLSAAGQLAICLRLILRLRPRPTDLRWYQLPPSHKRQVSDVRPWVDFGIDGKRYAAWDGCNRSGGSDGEHSTPAALAPDLGWQALAEAQQIAANVQHWIAAPRRLDIDPHGGLDQSHCLLVDYLAHQSAWAKMPSDTALPIGCAFMPHGQNSDWLEAMQTACSAI